MSMISHWYFTACLNMRPHDAASVIAILDALDLPTGDMPLAEAALKEIVLCDIWTRVYAVPQLFALAAADPSRELCHTVESIVAGLLNSCGADRSELGPETSSVLILQLVESALNANSHGRSEKLVAMIEAVAEALLDLGKGELEVVPYLLLPGLIPETIWLASVASLLSDVGQLGALREAYQEESSAATVALLRRCLAGERGRRAAIEAAKVLHYLGTEGSGMALAQRLVRLPRCLGKSEPDLVAVCAWLTTFDPYKPEIQESAVLYEFGSHRHFLELPRPKENCSARLGITHHDMPFFAKFAWDVSLITTAPTSCLDELSTEIKQRWMQPGNRQVTLDISKKNFAAGSNSARTACLCFAAVAVGRFACRLEPSTKERACLLTLAAHAEAVLSKYHDRWLKAAGRGLQGQAEASLRRDHDKGLQGKPGQALLSNETTTVALHTRSILKDLVYRSPVTPDEWLDLAEEQRWILPLLVGWLEDSMMGSQDDLNSLRWRKVIPEIVRMLPANMQGWSIPDQFSAGMLGRFLCKPVQLIGSLPWKNKLRGLLDRKQANELWRNVLAQPAAEAREWLDFDWLVTDPEVNRGMRVVAAVERFITHCDESPHPHIEAWRRAVHNELESKFTTWDVNRWLRFSLVDLVRHPQGGKAGKLALVLVIQLGQPVHVGRMVDALLSDASIPDLEWKVRFAAESLAARADAERHEEALRIRPNSPLQRLQSEASIHCWLSQCAALLAFCPISPAARRSQFSETRRRQLGLHRFGIIQTELVDAFVDRYRHIHDQNLGGFRPVLTAKSNLRHLGAWTHEQYIADPVHGHYQLLHANYWEYDQTKCHAEPTISLSLDTNGIATVVNFRTGKSSSHCTLPEENGLYHPGQLILARTHGGIEKIKQKPVEGQVFAAVGRRNSSGEMEFTVTGPVNTWPFTPRSRRDLFDPDASRGWREEFRNEKVEGLVMQFVNEAWRPMEQGIHDLVAIASDVVPFQIVLTVVSAGRKWLFSARPGTLFGLEEAHFAPQAWQLLQQRLDCEHGNLVGLRVTVTAERDTKSGRLMLVLSESDIDDVNLRWRDLLDEGDPIGAFRDASRNFVATLPSALAPFPTTLVVEWDGPHPRRNEDSVTCIVVGWDEETRRRGRVCLAKADVRKLRAESDDLAALHAWVLGLRIGTNLRLTSTIGKPQPWGEIRARTWEGIELNVSMDSLSLLPLNAGEFIPQERERSGMLKWVQRRRLTDRIIDFDEEVFATFPRGEYKGILFEVPDWGAGHTIATVLFLVNQVPILVRGSIIAAKCPRLGTEIVVNLSENHVDMHIYEVVLLAEAVFDEETVTDVPPEAWFTGMLVDGKQRMQVWECPSEPGNLMLVPGPHLTNIFFSADGNGVGCAMLPWAQCRNAARRFTDYDNQAVDVCLQIPQSEPEEGVNSHFEFIPGWCDGIRAVDFFRVRDVELRRVTLETGLNTIRRFFLGQRLEKIRDVQDDMPAHRDKVGRDREVELRNMWGAGKPVGVVALRAGRNQWAARVTDLRRQGFGNTPATLPVACDELHHFQDSDKIFATAERAMAMVLQTPEGWAASFKQVPALNLLEYQGICRVGLNVVHEPDALLFVGQVQDGDAWQLEFGIGHTLEVPLDHILVGGRPLKSLSSVIFYGDRIKKIAFSKDAEQILQLEIHEVDIEFGSAHQVFHQAKDWRFVHTLVLTAGETGEYRHPKVLSVKGFNEGSERVEREFMLTGASVQGLQADAWQERLVSTGNPISTYARLNTDRFVETQGRVCEFNPVRFVFGFGPEDLHPGDMILVEAGTMRRTMTGNDVRLQLLPLAGTLSGVTDDRPEPLMVMRREFSSREALLSRYLGHEVNSSDALAGMIFAVNIGLTFENGGARATMLKQPPRRWKPLVGALRAAGGGLFATVAPKRPEPDGATAYPNAPVILRVELRPGMFFELRKQHLEGELPHGCDDGTLVRMELSTPDANTGDRRVRVVVCQFSSKRYLSNRPNRPSILLPLDGLLKPSGPQRGGSGSAFTALDFPDLTFSACYWRLDQERWDGYLNREDLGELMSQQHPRFAWLWRMSQPGSADAGALVPAAPQDPAPGGRLVQDTAGLWFERVSRERLPTCWLQVTFSDVSVGEIQQQAQERRWFAHDSNTGHWNADGPPQLHSLHPLSSTDGFVFPIIEGESARLRFRPKELMDYGAPLGSLINTFGLESLGDDGYTTKVTVAGTTQDGSLYEGVWVEWAPGRVVELPIKMLVWRSGFERLPLSDFEWAHLSNGDELVIRLLAGDTLAPDRIEVLAWHRGQRAFGIGSSANQTLLPFAGTASDGSIVLGAGSVKLTLPFIPGNEPEPAWILTNTNHLIPGSADQLRHWDVALLALDGDRVIIAGSPEFTAAPHLHDDCIPVMDDHPVGSCLIGRDANGVRFYNSVTLRSIIRAMGGALPVTVEWVDHERKRVWFTFRRQMPIMNPGSVSQGNVLGSADGHLVWVRIGAGAIQMEVQDIIAGLPTAAHPDALQLLIKRRVPVWIRKPVEGENFTFGFCEDSLGDLSVEPVDMCREGGRAGLIVRSCRSQRLYWIPQEHLAWSELSAEWIEREWCGKQYVPVQAHLSSDGRKLRMSLLNTSSARRESEALRPGHQMQVTFEGRLDQSNATGGINQCWLVRSLDTKLLMHCDVPDNVKAEDFKNSIVEIATRQNHRTAQVTCTLQGHRVLPVELPPMQLEQWREVLNGEAVRTSGKELAERYAASNLDALMTSPELVASDGERLLHAYELIVRRSVFNVHAVEAVQAWERDARKKSVHLREALYAAAVLCQVVAGERDLISEIVNDDATERKLWEDSKSACCTLLAGLQSRCLRSLHLVAISSHIEASMHRRDRRFNASCEHLLKLLTNPMKENERQQFVKLATQHLMEEGHDRHEFAGALLACIGITPPPQAMPSRELSSQISTPAQVMLNLARVCSPFVNSPLDRLDMELATRMCESLRIFTEQVNQWSFEVWLLPPLPPVVIDQ